MPQFSFHLVDYKPFEAYNPNHKELFYQGKNQFICFYTLWEKGHSKRKWPLPSSTLFLQKKHKRLACQPQESILSQVVSQFLTANHIMKTCLGVINLSHINLHQSTFSLLNPQISQAELQEYSPVWDDVHISLSLSWITTDSNHFAMPSLNPECMILAFCCKIFIIIE